MAVSARPPFDLLDGDFYVRDTYLKYAWFRRHEPVAWDEGNQLWGVFRYDDVLEIEKNKQVFISSDQVKGGYRPNLPADPSIIGLDDPLHVKRRNLVSRRFTPRAVQSFEEHVGEVSSELIDAALAKGRAEIVDPERFDVTRQPNSHLAFGFGTHFCLGVALARLEIATFFDQLRRRVAAMRLAPGTVVEMPNAFVYGLRQAMVDFDPA